MKIGYLYRFEAFPPRGAQALHAHHLITAFQAAGHELCTLDPTVPGGRTFPETEAGIRDLLGSIDLLYVRIAGNYLTAWPAGVQAIRESPVPVVWEVNAPANENLAYSWLGGRRGRPGNAVARAVDRARRYLHARRVMPGIRKEERLRRELAPRVDRAITVSDAVGRYARDELGLDPVKVIHNGSDHRLVHPERTPAPLPPEAEGRLKLVYAGSPTAPWQGMDLLWEVMERQHSIDADLFWIFLVHSGAELIPTAPNVVVHESVPYEEVGSFLAAADVCLSLQPDFFWSPWGFHGSPMKLFDYMASGRAIIASRALSEVIEDGRNGVVADHTADDYLEKIERVAHDPDLRARVGAAARRDVEERYNWSVIGRETLDVFQAALAAPDRATLRS